MEKLQRALAELKSAQKAHTTLATQPEAGKQAYMYEKLINEKMAEVAAVEQGEQDEVLAAQIIPHHPSSKVKGLQGELEAALSSPTNKATLPRVLECCE